MSLAKMNPISKQIVEDHPNLHEETEEELFQISDIIYKNEFLAAFNLTEINDRNINMKIELLYSTLFKSDKKLDDKRSELLHSFMKTLAGKLMSEEIELGFAILFSYTYFHLTHLCLCDFFNDGVISDINLNALQESILE